VGCGGAVASRSSTQSGRERDWRSHHRRCHRDLPVIFGSRFRRQLGVHTNRMGELISTGQLQGACGPNPRRRPFLDSPRGYPEKRVPVSAAIDLPTQCRHEVFLDIRGGPYSGGRRVPENGFFTSGIRSGSGTSQSMQRNLRPPVFTSTKCMGLWHFRQEGGGGFLGMWTLTLDQAGAQHSQSPVLPRMGRVMTYCAPFELTKASQFRTSKQGRDPDLPEQHL
jgi:hypothetical protein